MSHTRYLLTNRSSWSIIRFLLGHHARALLGAVFHLSADLSNMAENIGSTRAIVTTVAIGGYGFLLMFYLAGVAGVPRRFAQYPEEAAQGIFYAKLSLAFISLLLIGALLYIWETGRRCVRALAA